MKTAATEIVDILPGVQRRVSGGAEALLPGIYDELRRLAAHWLTHERPGQTLQPTALVHEAYIRLVGTQDRNWGTRTRFFGAAAETMRRILIDRARGKQRLKRGAGRKRLELNDADRISEADPENLIALDEALAKLAEEDHVKAELVKLRYFGGLTVEQAAETLGISRATAFRYWAYARAWLYHEITKDDERPSC